MVSWEKSPKLGEFRERNVGTRGTLAVHAAYNHVTTRVLYIILRDRVKNVYPNLEDNTILAVSTGKVFFLSYP